MHIPPLHDCEPHASKIQANLREHSQSVEELDVFGGRESADGVHSRVDAPDAHFGQALLLDGIVAIAVEDHLRR